jgi:hypothetical protein
MTLTKARKAYAVVSKGATADRSRLFSSVGHIRTSYKWQIKRGTFHSQYDIVEFDIVELGTTKGEDFDTRFPPTKK